MMNATLRRKPDAGNPHVLFDEGEVASGEPGRGSVLYRMCLLSAVVFTAFALCADDMFYIKGKGGTCYSTFADVRTAAAAGNTIVNESYVAPQAYTYAVADTDLCHAEEIYPGTAVDKTAFTGIDLAEWRVAGGRINGAYAKPGFEAIVCKESGTDSDRTAWIQGLDGSYVKGVKVRLWQDGNVVKVRAIKAVYADGDRSSGHAGYCEAVDLDNDFSSSQSVAGSASAAGYGIQRLTLVRKTAAQRVTTAFVAGDTVTLGDYADVTISAPDALVSAMPTFTVPRRTRLTIEDLPACDVGDVFRGAGEVAFTNPDGEQTADVIWEGWNLTSWTLVAPGVQLTDVTGVTAEGLYNFKTMSQDVHPYFFVNDGNTARVQLQYRPDDYVRCICVDLRQGANGVEAHVNPSSHLYQYKKALGWDFDTNGYTGSLGYQSYPNGGGLSNLVFRVERIRQIRLTADLRYSSATNMTLTAGSNATVVVTGVNVPPAKCVLAAQDGGAMFLDTPGVNWYGLSDGRGQFDVRRGGELRFCRANQSRAYADQRFRVSGGTVFCAAHDLNTGDAGNYINELILEDGAVLSGARPRTGYTLSPTWRIRGASASTLKAGFILAPNSGGVRTLTLDVQDVTGDDGADLVVQGKIADFDSSSCAALTKTGAGTVLVECSWSQKAVFSLKNGTWKLARNATTAGSVNVSLDGGCLSADASTTNAFAALALTTSSQIAVADGAELAFADTSAKTWPTDVRLDVTSNPLASTIRFGSSATGLTDAQMRCIRLNGRRAKLLDDGSLVSNAPGMMFIVK